MHKLPRLIIVAAFALAVGGTAMAADAGKKSSSKNTKPDPEIAQTKPTREGVLGLAQSTIKKIEPTLEGDDADTITPARLPRAAASPEPTRR